LIAAGWSPLAMEGVTLALIFVVGGIVIPFGAAWIAGQLSRLALPAARRHDVRHTVAQFAPAFIPLGMGVWAAHYGFHFLVGFFSVIPAFQAFLLDHRVGLLGDPNWTLGGMPNLELIGGVQVILMMGGYAISLWIAQKIALRLYKRQAMTGLLPFALLLTLMLLAGLWLFSQPMEMRGTIFD
jgi:hypothetical protein